MRTAVDTNVISALWSGEPASRGMAELLGRAQSEGGLVISAPVYAELLAYPSATLTFVRQFLEATHVVTDFSLDEAVWQASRGSLCRLCSAAAKIQGRLAETLVGRFHRGCARDVESRSFAHAGRGPLQACLP